jgi:hypothetical protein
MKKGLLAALLIFSLALNVAVAGTVGWYLWYAPAAVQQRQQVPSVTLSQDDARLIASLWPSKRRAAMMQMRQELVKKKTEILEMIAQNPGNIQAVEPQINELTALRGQMERQALAKISTIMAGLPPEKRQTFLAFLKTRACMGPGMKRRLGRGMGGICPPEGAQFGTGRSPEDDSPRRGGPRWPRGPALSE